MPAETYLRSGKVRDLYAMPAGRLALVASDRISAFDVVLPTDIPDKGRVLTGLSRYWFAETETLVPNHLLSTGTDDPALRGRIMICRSVEVIPIEAVVRGYLAGSGWKAYIASGSVCGVRLPSGLREADRLPEPIFTPATKAELGEHDENIDFETMAGPRRPSDSRTRPRAGAGAVRPCERAHRTRGDPPRRHEVRVRVGPGDGAPAPDRRGPHPGLVAILGCFCI